MGDASNASSGFQTKAAYLLNKKTFSDLEIHVKDGVVKKVFPAHKLFLAMNSRVFGEMLYLSSESPNVITINDYTPDIVFLMLRYMYTYKIDINTAEARQLYTLSKKFGIRNLQDFCVNLISDKELSKDNVLYMYECALREKFARLLSKCRGVVSTYTNFVFDSPSFVETPSAVVEDILQLEALTVDNEIDVLKAVVKWSHYECKRQKLPVTSANVRQCITPFLPKLRFLTLNIDQFSDFSKTHNFLSTYEGIIIASKLLRPNDAILSLPSYMCSISETRVRPIKLLQGQEKQKTITNSNLTLISSNYTSSHDNKTVKRFSDPQKHSFNHNLTSYNALLLQNEKTDELIYPQYSIFNSTSNGALSSHNDKGDVKTSQKNTFNSSSSNALLPTNDKSDTTVCLPQKKNHANTLNNSLLPRNNFSLTLPEKNVKTPNSNPKGKPENYKVLNKTYEIQLHVTQKVFNMAFKNDVKCSMTLQLLKGAIQVNIIELKICQESETEENINVYLQLSYSNSSSKSDTYTTVLKNSFLQLTLNQPLRVFEKNHVEIEVTIEDLQLNRCCIIKNPICQLKQGTDFVADMALTSNQMNKDSEYFFLISRIFYEKI